MSNEYVTMERAGDSFVYYNKLNRERKTFPVGTLFQASADIMTALEKMTYGLDFLQTILKEFKPMGSYDVEGLVATLESISCLGQTALSENHVERQLINKLAEGEI